MPRTFQSSVGIQIKTHIFQLLCRDCTTFGLGDCGPEGAEVYNAERLSVANIQHVDPVEILAKIRSEFCHLLLVNFAMHGIQQQLT